MKDHELKELINDVTAVARLYANTQQLRQQVANLIEPAFREMENKNAFLRGFKLGAEERIKNLCERLGEKP